MVWALLKSFSICDDKIFMFFCEKGLGVFFISYKDIMDEKKTPKNAEKIYCKYCDFNCSKNSDWVRHISRPKHLESEKGYKMVSNDDKKTPKNAEKGFDCGCGKKYKHYSGFWRHKKNCDLIGPENTLIHDTPKDQHIDKDEIIKYLMKENSEFKEMMIELCKNGTNVINNSNNMNNSHNKTFNLQIFLNETCKDAMNIMDFVDSLKLQLCDLERIGEVGFVTGISDIIIKNLKALDISKRPVHCADTKREVMYVKDNDKWEKEQEGNKKLKKAIKHIAKKNSMNINLFKDKYPDCINSYSRKSDQFNKIYIEAYGGSGNEDVDNENKIIKNIAKVVGIDKSL